MGQSPNQLFQLPVIAAGICSRTVSTPNGKAQNAFGASFNHSGIGFWEIDFANTQPNLDPTKTLLTVTIGDGGPGVAGYQYGVQVAGGPLYAISTFRSDTNAQADIDIHVKFELLPTQK